MKADLNKFKRLFERLGTDDCITPYHIAMVFAIVQLADGNVGEDFIKVSRRKVMKLAHIGSIATYHKCIKDLQRHGYIEYYPSYHPGIQSRIYPGLFE